MNVTENRANAALVEKRQVFASAGNGTRIPRPDIQKLNLRKKH
jgi:hypothetical protein